jgi:hypothetical protein
MLTTMLEIKLSWVFQLLLFSGGLFLFTAEGRGFGCISPNFLKRNSPNKADYDQLSERATLGNLQAW